MYERVRVCVRNKYRMQQDTKIYIKKNIALIFLFSSSIHLMYYKFLHVCVCVFGRRDIRLPIIIPSN